MTGPQYNTLQRTATHCNTLQHTATHCDSGMTCVHADILTRNMQQEACMGLLPKCEIIHSHVKSFIPMCDMPYVPA